MGDEKINFSPSALVRIVLNLPMMKKVLAAFLCVVVVSLLSGATPSPQQGRTKGAAPEIKPEDMSAAQLMQVLNEANLLARPYYNGVPDLSARGRGYGETRRETRGEVLDRLSKIIIPSISSNTFDGVSLQDAVPVLSLLINRSNSGQPINFYVNQFLRGAQTSTTPAAPGVGAGNNQLPGLPGGGGMGMMPGGGGMPGGDDGGGAGDPFGGAGGGAPGAPQMGGNGVPGGGVVANGGAFPGLPVGGPAIMPGGGSGGPLDMGSKDLGAFRPERVKVTGFSAGMYNVSAKDFLEEFVTHIQKDLEINRTTQGYDYKVTNLGIAIVEASADNFINGQRVYSRMIPVRPNLFGGQQLKPPVTGGTQQGGQQGGRPGGQMGGMGGQMGGMGGQMGGMGGQMGGMGGQMGGMGGQMGGGMGGMGMNPMMGGGMGGMGGGMYRYRRGSRAQQVAPQPQNLQNRYRSFNFRRR